MVATKKILLFTSFAFLIVVPFTAHADLQGCVYNRSVYPHGSEMCQGGTMMRCEEGAWAATGFCKNEPMPEPISSGGDVVESDEE